MSVSVRRQADLLKGRHIHLNAIATVPTSRMSWRTSTRPSRWRATSSCPAALGSGASSISIWAPAATRSSWTPASPTTWDLDSAPGVGLDAFFCYRIRVSHRAWPRDGPTARAPATRPTTAVLRRLQRPNVERYRRPSARGDDAIDQELGCRHVASCAAAVSTDSNTASMLSAASVSKRARAALVKVMETPPRVVTAERSEPRRSWWPCEGQGPRPYQLFEHLVGESEDHVRNRKAERLRSLPFMTNSKRVGCSTGSSPGSAPFRILST